jgi:hypothetical protein
MMPAAMSFFDLSQFLPLFVRENASDFPMRFSDDLMHAPAGVAPHFVKLGSGFIQDRGDFGDLVRSQIQLSLQSLAHSLADDCGTRCHEEKMPRVLCAQESTRHTASEKNQEETSD